MADEASNILRQALAATQAADATQRKKGGFFSSEFLLYSVLYSISRKQFDAIICSY